jgi:hypothetical protein
MKRLQPFTNLIFSLLFLTAFFPFKTYADVIQQQTKNILSFGSVSLHMDCLNPNDTVLTYAPNSLFKGNTPINYPPNYSYPYYNAGGYPCGNGFNISTEFTDLVDPRGVWIMLETTITGQELIGMSFDDLKYENQFTAPTTIRSQSFNLVSTALAVSMSDLLQRPVDNIGIIIWQGFIKVLLVGGCLIGLGIIIFYVRKWIGRKA